MPLEQQKNKVQSRGSKEGAFTGPEIRGHKKRREPGEIQIKTRIGQDAEGHPTVSKN